jgi:ribosomal protein L19
VEVSISLQKNGIFKFVGGVLIKRKRSAPSKHFLQKFVYSRVVKTIQVLVFENCTKVDIYEFEETRMNLMSYLSEYKKLISPNRIWL